MRECELYLCIRVSLVKLGSSPDIKEKGLTSQLFTSFYDKTSNFTYWPNTSEYFDSVLSIYCIY